jgi:hypothetical protein
MKKTFSKIKLTAIMLFTSLASLISKTMWQVWWWSSTQSFYWVAFPEKEAVWIVVWKQPSFLSSMIDIIIKCIEWALVWVIFLIGVINYLKIKKIDDKELRKKKIKKTVIIIAIIAIIDILIALWYRMYENNMFDNILGK